MRHRTKPVPTSNTTISRGVWNTTRCASWGSTAVRAAAATTTATAAAATVRTPRQLGCRPMSSAAPSRPMWGPPSGASVVSSVGRPLPPSATIRLGRDADRGDDDPPRKRPPDPGAEPGLRPVEGDGDVGPDDRLRWVARGEVDRRRRVDRQDRHTDRTRPLGHLHGAADGLAKRAADAGAEQRVDDQGGFADTLAEDHDIPLDRRMEATHARLAPQPPPVASRVGRPGARARRDERDDAIDAPPRQPPRGDEAVTAVVAGPGEDEHRSMLETTSLLEDRASDRRNSRTGMLHEHLARDAERLRPPIRPGHRLGRDRRPCARVRPSLLERAQIETGEIGVVCRKDVLDAAARVE